jgi:protein-disulfide isomerase
LAIYPQGLGFARLAAAALFLAAAMAPATAADIDVDAAMSERALGNADAPVTIVEYASMTCPHCASFHAETWPELKKRYVDTGKVRFVFSNFVLNAIDLRASMMARCAPAPQFFGLTDVLFKTQNAWARAADPVAEMAKIGRLAGMKQETIESCLASEPLANALVAMRQQGTEAGVASTPTFIINGERVVGGHSIDELAEIIDPLLDR